MVNTVNHHSPAQLTALLGQLSPLARTSLTISIILNNPGEKLSVLDKWYPGKCWVFTQEQQHSQGKIPQTARFLPTSQNSFPLYPVYATAPETDATPKLSAPVY